MKTCSKCKESKPLTEFWKQSSNRDGLHIWCKGCAGASHKQWVENNRARSAEIKREWCARYPERSREIARKHYRTNRKSILEKDRQRRYGVSAKDVEQMRLTQGGVCAICKVSPKRFHVDHNHLSGKVRALLCGNCNLALGHLKDSAILARAAATYLDKHNFPVSCRD